MLEIIILTLRLKALSLEWLNHKPFLNFAINYLDVSWSYKLALLHSRNGQLAEFLICYRRTLRRTAWLQRMEIFSYDTVSFAELRFIFSRVVERCLNQQGSDVHSCTTALLGLQRSLVESREVLYYSWKLIPDLLTISCSRAPVL